MLKSPDKLEEIHGPDLSAAEHMQSPVVQPSSMCDCRALVSVEISAFQAAVLVVFAEAVLTAAWAVESMALSKVTLATPASSFRLNSCWQCISCIY